LAIATGEGAAPWLIQPISCDVPRLMSMTFCWNGCHAGDPAGGKSPCTESHDYKLLTSLNAPVKKHQMDRQYCLKE